MFINKILELKNWESDQGGGGCMTSGEVKKVSGEVHTSPQNPAMEQAHKDDHQST